MSKLVEFLKKENAWQAAFKNMLECRPDFIGKTEEEAIAYMLETPAIENVSSMFGWADTPEGHKYWSALDEKFREEHGIESFEKEMTGKDDSEGGLYKSILPALKELEIYHEVRDEIRKQTDLPIGDIEKFIEIAPGVPTLFSFEASEKGKQYWKDANEKVMDKMGLTDADILMRLLTLK